MAENQVRAVLDTNILVSAFLYGGKPQQVVELIIDKHIKGIISRFILSELLEVLRKKFGFDSQRLKFAETKTKNPFRMVHPIISVNLVKDTGDNRVLEAALEGNCEFIITGDKELLKLKSFRGIKILTASEFLDLS